MIHQRVLAVLSVSIALSACASMGKGSAAQAPGGGEGSRRNPFLDVNFFLNPEYVASVEATAKAFPAEAEAIRKVKQYPTGLWLDSIAHVANLPLWLAEARKQQQASGKPTLSVVVVYDLPNRDCAANRRQES